MVADYRTNRLTLLALLTAEEIDPYELAAACAEDPVPQYQNLAEIVRGDLSLRLVWLAGRIHPG